MNGLVVLIIKNIEREGPGKIEDMLKRRRAEYEIICPDNDSILPRPNEYSAAIVMGGPNSANDKTNKIIQEIEFARNCVKFGVPYLGICLGMQILCIAHGAKITKNIVPEIGFSDENKEQYNIMLNCNGEEDLLFSKLPQRIPIFQLHYETAIMLGEIKLLASSTQCEAQVIKVGDLAYGFQGHIEITQEVLNRLAEEDLDLKRIKKEELFESYNRMRKEYELCGERIIGNFLNIAGV